MRIDRIMGVVLSVLILSFVAFKHIESMNDFDRPIELIGDNGYISENIVNYDDKLLSANDSYRDVIEFTNTNIYPIEMNQNDITINCTGTGITKEDDETLVSGNYNIKAKFSEEINSDLYDSLLVPRGKTIYIHVIGEYRGDMPSNQVLCDYSLNIQSA